MAVAELPTEFAKKVLLSTLAEIEFDPRTLHYEVLNAVEGGQENWLGSVYKVAVYPDKTDSSNKLSLFVKCLVKSPRATRFRNAMFFKNEVGFYEQILPAFLNLQEHSKARVTTPFTGVPKCYKAVSDGHNDVLILEDLSTRGFLMPSRLEGMNLEETQMMFEELGRLHGLSLALKDQKPDKFSEISKAVSDVLFVNMERDPFKTFIEVGFEDTLQLLKEKYPHDSCYVTKSQHFADSIHARSKLLMEPDPDDRYNVINHGDIWINNFMFHYTGEGSERKPDAMCFLDFQISSYSSLGIELSCALYTTVDQKMRDEYREDLLHCYHDAMCKLLAELGSDPKKIIPFSVLEDLLRKYSVVGVAVAGLNVPSQLHLSTESNMEGPEAAVNSMLSNITHKTERCKQWMTDLVVDVIDRGYIDYHIEP